jgi:RNA polymerase sigma factor for flagellar operon FliA
MYKSTINSSIRLLKSSNAEAKLFVDIDEAMFVSDEGNDGDYEMYHARSALVSEALSNLDAKDKAMVEMYFYGSMSLTDIGKIMNVSPRKVSKILTKSIEKIKNIVINNEMCYE